jgi:hypothetical protein
VQSDLGRIQLGWMWYYIMYERFESYHLGVEVYLEAQYLKLPPKGSMYFYYTQVSLNNTIDDFKDNQKCDI